MDARDAVKLVQLVYRVHIRSRPQVDVLGYRSRNHLVSSSTHNLLQTTIHNVLLSRSLQQQTTVEFLSRNVRCFLDHV